MLAMPQMDIILTGSLAKSSRICRKQQEKRHRGIHLGKMERRTQRLWASGVWEESLLVRNLGLAGSMVEELAGAEGSLGLLFY